MIMIEKRQTNRKLIKAGPSGCIYHYTDNIVLVSTVKTPDWLVLKSKVFLTAKSTILFYFKVNLLKTIMVVGKIIESIQSESDWFLLTVHIEYIKLRDLQLLQSKLMRYEVLSVENQTTTQQKLERIVSGSMKSFTSWSIKIKDLGMKGVRIVTAEKITATDTIQLMFLLPTKENVVVFGKIVWDKGLHNNTYEYGIQFTKCDKTAREQIKKYLQTV